MSAVLALAAALLCFPCYSLVHAEVTQQGTLRVSFEGNIKPHTLPRLGTAPVAVSLSGAIRTTDRSAPPQLRRINMAINRHGRLDLHGLPLCHYHQIQPASTHEAFRACRSAIVGEGTFRAHVSLPEQSPFPNNGRVLAFNGLLHGDHVLFAHVYGTSPLPQSNVLIFRITRTPGTYKVNLTADLPRVAADWGYVSGISLKLRRTFSYRGHLHSYLSAGCPAPDGIRQATFPFARASFDFEGDQTLRAKLTRSCGARG